MFPSASLASLDVSKSRPRSHNARSSLHSSSFLVCSLSASLSKHSQQSQGEGEEKEDNERSVVLPVRDILFFFLLFVYHSVSRLGTCWVSRFRLFALCCYSPHRQHEGRRRKKEFEQTNKTSANFSFPVLFFSISSVSISFHLFSVNFFPSLRCRSFLSPVCMWRHERSKRGDRQKGDKNKNGVEKKESQGRKRRAKAERERARADIPLHRP